MSTYTTTLDVSGEVDSYNVELQAGSIALTVQFTWPLILNTKYDEVLQGIEVARNSDPLVGVNYKNKDYDLLDYYTNQMPYPVTLSWVEAQAVLPVTVYSLTDSQQYVTLKERQETYKAIKEMLALWEESLAWNVTITDSSGNQRTGYVRPGGTIKAEELGWSIRFLADVTHVSQTQLSLLTVEVDVED